MTYASIVEMTASRALIMRVAACAANEGVGGNPEAWASTNIWTIVSTDPQWVARWDDANFNYNPTYNPETGERPDVITDEVILAVVQPMLLAMNPVIAPEPQTGPGPDPGTGQTPEDLEEAPT